MKRVLQDDVYIEGIYDTNYLPEFLQRTDAKSLIDEIERAAGEQTAGIDLAAIKIDGSDELKVLSPTTAIFYITPTPSEPQFVSVGDKISVADTCCQLEAMKIFTPLSLADFNVDSELYDADTQFEVTRINMSNGQQVNAGDLLFVVKPLAA